MRRRLSLAVTVIGTLLLVLAVGYFVGRQAPALSTPISIDAASALADGGSMHIVLQDAKGRRYAVGVQGCICPQSDFRVYVQPWYSWFPVPIPIARKSEQEKALLAAVETWSKKLAGTQPGYELLDQVASVLRSSAR